MTKQQIGVVGMAVMGRNIALNIESRGYSVSLYNRTGSKTTEVLEQNPGKNLVGTYTVEEFVNSLESPRKILLMVQAGRGTDATIDALLPHLDKGDIVIDGGNTFFKDTIRRSERLAELGINFVGTGVSGGEEGALHGPSIMPGGPQSAYELVAPILRDISAKAPEDGEPCVTYIGENGAGHYVKMVHNGIEYGDMQLIAESYDLLHRVLGLSAAEISQIFGEWNKGELDSFLMEISTQILATVDPSTGKPMVDVIMDRAGNKGTGKWTSQSALDLGEPLSLITESVFARYISTFKEERVAASQVIPGVDFQANLSEADKKDIIEAVRQALYFSKIVSYAQGFAQMKAASQEYGWTLNYGEIAKIFRAGCIIRAKFLQKITDAYSKNPDLDNLMLDDYFLNILGSNQAAVRRVVTLAIQAGIPVPTFSSALAYYDSYRSPVLPANLIQAQRDLFGAHTYQRVDRPGTFHFHWNQGREEQLED
ncbi:MULTISPECIES: NADP-dependent phosphogluconate dehydrogenase [Abiotrophia]|jgi:phosphogluconate dehydrogenase (decarboxylating)|uniref:NADP-dependent phosphogluconate dehydrogenase n=1 Tax=Abiotrophia TaxID=46123 RepID=UPI000F21AB63|nr:MULTISPECIES: NADP-dependent phosphogluconate dehydrogenase [Abiotrophia]MBF0936494.1 NADP-dependent phosphogluconate dehydrogenase [Abiotrophia sp.]MBF0941611.1 NADP-dependent phosphogluconate dehydrogenase [Abiotrophia sp.]MCY7224635.1 NADP-dependent phosphogluconate dehydrogenase [Abiotrophia defectiva]RKW19304.1 MAG: NADP-dependent phosphogluconate dehydrogenase [Catonella sp.]